jgi:hypothetical protein
MTERELLELWAKARGHLILSQMAPTFLLIVTAVALGLGLDRANLWVRVGVLGILLASGVLGALVQYSVAAQALAIADDLSELPTPSATTRQAISFAPWMNVARFVTPTIFMVIFFALSVALLVGPEFGPHGRM